MSCDSRVEVGVDKSSFQSSACARSEDPTSLLGCACIFPGLTRVDSWSHASSRSLLSAISHR